MNYNTIFLQLEKDLTEFISKNPKFKPLLMDSFIDHKDRYKKDLDVFNEYFKGGKILEIGSNPFHITYCLKNLGYEITGIDVNPDPFEQFLEKHKLDIKKVNIEIEALPFKNNTFELILLNEVFEHLMVDPIFVLKEINRVLKPGGILILTTPNLYAFHKILMFLSGRSINDAYDEFNKKNIYGYIGHIREYSTYEIKKFLEKTNFKIKNVEYLNHYSFFRYAGFKNIFIKLLGLFVDIVMKVVPSLRRHQVFIASKS